MRRFVAPLLAAVAAFSQAAPPVTSVTPKGSSPAQASAQATPLTATKTRVTYAIGSAGGITVKSEERGIFSRNSGGDEATHLKVIRDGQAALGTRMINQRKDRMSYVIDDSRQQYRVVAWPEGSATSTDVEHQLGTVVTRTIENLKCVAVPVRDSSGKIVGKDWVSPEYGITVRSEVDVLNPQTGIATGLVVEELTEIRMGAAPDPGEFVIPTGYKRLSGNPD